MAHCPQQFIPIFYGCQELLSWYQKSLWPSMFTGIQTLTKYIIHFSKSEHLSLSMLTLAVSFSCLHWKKKKEVFLIRNFSRGSWPIKYTFLDWDKIVPGSPSFPILTQIFCMPLVLIIEYIFLTVIVNESVPLSLL